jgi:hypothetical protein
MLYFGKIHCVFTVIVCLVCIIPSFAEDLPSKEKPWKNFSVDLVWSIADVDTSLNLGVKGLGIVLDAEDFFNLDATTSIFRANAYWRFTNNQRHRLDFKWYSLRRDGSTTIGQDIIIEGPGGNDILLPIGTNVYTNLDIDIYKTSYSYSIFQDDRMDFAVGIGFYVMPIDIGLNASGIVQYDNSERFTAPLPTLGFRADFAITPKFFFRNHIDLLYLEIDQFRGSIWEATIGLEYLFWKYFGIGLAFDTFRLNIESDGEDYPGIDFKGTLDFKATGLNLYVKLFY